MPHHEVKVYALSTCIHCRKAKEFLDEHDIEFDCVHVDKLTGDDRTKCIDEVKIVNPAVSFPTIVIDGSAVVGFKKDMIKKLLGLD